nr:phage major capsid protein [Paracraurococcus ruber]
MLEKQNQTFEAFKQANDDRLKQLEQKGAADAVTVDKVEKLSAELDRLGDNFKALERLATLPGRGVDRAFEEKQAARLATANLHLQSIAGLAGRQTKLFDAEQLAKYETDFREFLRSGRDHEMQSWHRQDFQITVDGDGGFLVPPDMSGRLVTRLYERSDMLPIVNVQQVTASEMEGIMDTADVDAGWRGETEPVTDSTNTSVSRYSIQVEEMWSQPRASTRLIADAAVNIETWVADKLGDRFARLGNAAIVAGDGIKKPRGFLSYPSNTTADASRTWGTLQRRGTGASGAIGTNPFDILIDLTMDLKPAYRRNARWVAARATFAQYRKAKDTTGQYLWQPPVQAGMPATMLGYPITEAEDMPALAANSDSLAFGDFQEAYTVVERAGITILRDPYTAKGWVRFYATRRMGGGLVNSEALKILRAA